MPAESEPAYTLGAKGKLSKKNAKYFSAGRQVSVCRLSLRESTSELVKKWDWLRPRWPHGVDKSTSCPLPTAIIGVTDLFNS
jgi:hypothetical protein